MGARSGCKEGAHRLLREVLVLVQPSHTIPPIVRDYLERGFSIVPIKAGGKTPLVKWREYQSRPATISEVQEWVRRYPDCGWAVVTGPVSGLVVIDADSADADGKLNQWGLPVAPTVKTPRGRHYYFQHPGTNVATRKLMDECDVRGDGGLAILPPSPDRTWEVPLSDSPLPLLPSWFQTLSQTFPDAGRTEPDVTTERPSDPEAYARAALQYECELLRETVKGGRNIQTNKSAFAMGTIIANHDTGAIDEASVGRDLLRAAVESGLSADEARIAITSGLAAGLPHSRWPKEQQPLPVAGLPSEDLFPILGVDQIERLPDPEYLIADILPQGGSAQVYGRKGSCKTFLVVDWGLCVASGRDWNGHRVQCGPVVHVFAEGQGGIKKRLKAWEAEFGPLPQQFYAVPVAVNLLELKQVEKLVRTIRSVCGDPSLIIFDTLHRCTPGAEENNSAWGGAVISAMDAVRQQWPRATTVVVHHPGKNQEKGPRGHSSLEGALDTIVAVKKTTTGIELTCEKQKEDEEFKPIHLKPKVVRWGESKAESSCVLLPGDRAPRVVADPPRENTSDRAAMEALSKTGETGMKHKDWFKASGLRKSTFQATRTRLKKRGQVEKVGGLYRVRHLGDAKAAGEVGVRPSLTEIVKGTFH